MFEVGFSELLVILALALVVLGPEKLPRVASQVGRWVGRARAMARQFREQLEEEANKLDITKDSPPRSAPGNYPPPPAAARPPPYSGPASSPMAEGLESTAPSSSSVADEPLTSSPQGTEPGAPVPVPLTESAGPATFDRPLQPEPAIPPGAAEGIDSPHERRH